MIADEIRQRLLEHVRENQRRREEFNEHSRRLAEIISDGAMDDVNEWTAELERRLRQAHEAVGKDSDVSSSE